MDEGRSFRLEPNRDAGAREASRSRADVSEVDRAPDADEPRDEALLLDPGQDLAENLGDGHAVECRPDLDAEGRREADHDLVGLDACSCGAGLGQLEAALGEYLLGGEVGRRPDLPYASYLAPPLGGETVPRPWSRVVVRVGQRGEDVH